MKLIEGVHFHYQLRSAYEHRSHKPVPKYVTPLQFVCLKGKVLLTRELIKNGAYVYVKGGQTALHYGWAYADCVQLLIGSGADVNAHDEREEIPEDKAKKWERTQCLKML